MLLGVISDTHLGRPEQLTRLERLLARQLGGADVIIHAGDHDGQLVEDFLEYIEPRPYYGVAGNCDVGRAGCRLPPRRVITLEGVSIGVTHGVGVVGGAEELLRDELESEFNVELDLLIFGHTHRPLIKWSGHTLILNPGSPFEPRHGGAGTVALVKLVKPGKLNKARLTPELVKL